MSVYRNDVHMRSWACERMEIILDKDRYPTLFAAIDAPKRSKRLSLTQLGVLRLLLDSRWRPDRDEKTQLRYGMSACLNRAEIAEMLGVSSSAVSRSVRGINTLAMKGAQKSDIEVRKLGLILFNELGYCFKPNLGDTDRSRSFSRKQLSGQVQAHSSNLQLADEKDRVDAEDAEILARIQSMTPAERIRLVKAAG